MTETAAEQKVVTRLWRRRQTRADRMHLVEVPPRPKAAAVRVDELAAELKQVRESAGSGGGFGCRGTLVQGSAVAGF